MTSPKRNSDREEAQQEKVWQNTGLTFPFRRGLHSLANVRRHETPAYKRAGTSILPLLKSHILYR